MSVYMCTSLASWGVCVYVCAASGELGAEAVGMCVHCAASQQLCLAPPLRAAPAEKCRFSNLGFPHHIYRYMVDESL